MNNSFVGKEFRILTYTEFFIYCCNYIAPVESTNSFKSYLVS